MSQITLTPLTADDREQFILDNQEAFRYGAMKEFGLRDDHFEEGGEIISRRTIEKSIDGGVAYRIREDGKIVGGMVLKIDEKTQINELELLFITPGSHSRGIGTAAWQAAEHLYPDTRVWQTCTPYFEKRNIHFYINKCGFHAVEFFCKFHPEPVDPDGSDEKEEDGRDDGEMFLFRKVMSPGGNSEPQRGPDHQV